MSDQNAQPTPVLTVDTPRPYRVPGQQKLVTDGVRIKLRNTHPGLWRALMVYAVTNVLLGLNFVVLQPTFPIYGRSNYWWGASFILLGLSKVVFINLLPNLKRVRITMALEVAFTFFIAFGTTEPFLRDMFVPDAPHASLQLPIVYVALAIIELQLLLEPFINPWTARRDSVMPTGRDE